MRHQDSPKVVQAFRPAVTGRPEGLHDFCHDVCYICHLHTKFAASSVLPAPLYTAVFGYAHSGRVRTTCPSTVRDAGIRSGATPDSTHRSTAATMSNVLVPSPPPQWPIPGTMNARTESRTVFLSGVAASTPW